VAVVSMSKQEFSRLELLLQVLSALAPAGGYQSSWGTLLLV